MQSARQSIIIVAHNGRRHLEEHLWPMVQSVGKDTEIIVVDNQSEDGTAGWIGLTFPEIKVVLSSFNLGYSGGGNLGARHATGEILIFLNQDIQVSQSWLRPLLQPFSAEPQIGLTTPLIMLKKQPSVVNAAGNETHLSGVTLCRKAGAARDEAACSENVTAVSGAAFAIRRRLFERLGGFDPAFFMYCEDSDLSLRARLAGYRCQFTPGSVVYHDYQLQFGSGKLFLQERNRYMMLIKAFRWRTLLLMLPTLLVGEVVSWGFALSRGSSCCREKIKAYGYLLRQWRAIKRARQQTQWLRAADDRAMLEQMGWRLAFEQAGSPRLASAAHLMFDPIFFILSWITRKLVAW